jgi:hypothetical protein
MDSAQTRSHFISQITTRCFGDAKQYLSYAQTVCDSIVVTMEATHMPYNYLTTTEYNVTTGLGETSALLSILGSSGIIYLILREDKAKGWDVKPLFYHIMLGLSAADLICSVGFFIQPFAAPQYMELPLAMGNGASCTASGILSSFILASSIYSAELAVYFYMSARDVRQKPLFSGREWVVHIVPLAATLTFASGGAFFRVFQPSVVLLGGCLGVTCQEKQEGDCSGRKVLPYVFLGNMLQFGVLLTALVGVVAVWLLYNNVRKQLRRLRAYACGDTASHPQTELRNRNVLHQAVCYTLSFMNSFLMMILASLLLDTFERSNEALAKLQPERPLVAVIVVMLVFALMPLQGFLNWLVFVRPRLVRWKLANLFRCWTPWTIQQCYPTETNPTSTTTVAQPGDGETLDGCTAAATTESHAW